MSAQLKCTYTEKLQTLTMPWWGDCLLMCIQNHICLLRWQEQFSVAEPLGYGRNNWGRTQSEFPKAIVVGMLGSEQYCKRSLYLGCFCVHKMAIIAGRETVQGIQQLREPQLPSVPIWLLCLSLEFILGPFRSVSASVGSRFLCVVFF